MPPRNPPDPIGAAPVLSLDLSQLLRSVHETAREAAREGAREAVTEAFKAREADAYLTSEQAAVLLGYSSPAAFKMARGRNLELGALGIKVGRCWRFRRSDLEAWIAAHPRRGKAGA